jgi:soluble lytic murein transglycosylase
MLTDVGKKSIFFNHQATKPPRFHARGCWCLGALVVFTLLTFSPLAHANDAALVNAVKVMDAERWSAARDAVYAARDPLAKKLYLWMYLKKEKGAVGFSKLARFVQDNPQWPGINMFREQAERDMPEDLPRTEVLAWFDAYPPLTARGLDLYLDALLIAGRKAEAKKILDVWWAERLSTRDEQKDIYYKYGRMIDMNAHRRRLDNLLFSEQYSNARGIAQALGPGFPELVEARIAIAEEKGNINGLISKIPSNLQSDPGLLFERMRWRRKNDMDFDAAKILRNHPPASQIQNPDDWWREQHILIRRLLQKQHFEGAYKLASIHFQEEGPSYAEAEWTAGWLALRFMNKPGAAYERFKYLYDHVKTPISKARAAYWSGRAAEAAGDSENATLWYQKAAKYQTAYYGQLAGARLGLAEALPNAAPPTLTEAEISAFSRDDLMRAALIFHKAGMRDTALKFMDAFVEHHNSKQAYRYAAETASKIGEKREALKIAKEATKEGLFLTAQAFPVITDSLRNVGIEWALVHGVIRQESMFDTTAISPAGARGLMQLMPATAREVAGKMGVSINNEALISNPSRNIMLGSAYMDGLLRRYDGFYPMAIAAYNAGPGNVNKWIKMFGDPRQGDINLIDWVELIPIYETRNYVQRVLESVYIYRLRLKGVQKNRDNVNPIHVQLARGGTIK